MLITEQAISGQTAVSEETVLPGHSRSMKFKVHLFLIGHGLLLLCAGCQSCDEPRGQLIGSTWELVHLRGREVVKALSPLTAEFMPDGRVQCQGGINVFGGRYGIQKDRFSFHMSSTTLAGSSRALEEQEEDFQRAMEEASIFTFDGGGRLILRNSGGRDLAVFRKIPQYRESNP